MDLAQQVGDVASLIGLLLALDTLFTAEQSRRLEKELIRDGGPRSEILRSVLVLSIGLAVLTATTIVMLWPLVQDVLATVGDGPWNPVLGIFVVTYVLLVALVVWQTSLSFKVTASRGP